ncbi:MAG: cell division protein FtsQ/DivIB [Planctomycetota bacterium]
MAKKKKTKRSSFRFSQAGKKKKRNKDYLPSLKSFAKISAVIIMLAGVGAGFVFLERFVRKTVPVSGREAVIELVGAPGWINEQLKERIFNAAKPYGGDLKIDENAAASVQQNIEAQVAWLDDIVVQATHDRVRIKARWRKPLVLVKKFTQPFYLDAEMVVLDYLPMSSLPIVEAKDLPLATKQPLPGDILHSQSLSAGVAIIAKLDRMDDILAAEKPLLYEIASIDVTNYQGRQNSQRPHILLYTTDNTQVIWGAQLGAWQRYMEAPDEEKLTKLYDYYTKRGSLLGSAKYINLCDPQDSVPQPIDKY